MTEQGSKAERESIAEHAPKAEQGLTAEQGSKAEHESTAAQGSATEQGLTAEQGSKAEHESTAAQGSAAEQGLTAEQGSKAEHDSAAEPHAAEATEEQLRAAHRAARARRAAAPLGSEAYLDAIEEIGRIEVEMARVGREASPPRI